MPWPLKRRNSLTITVRTFQKKSRAIKGLIVCWTVFYVNDNEIFNNRVASL